MVTLHIRMSSEKPNSCGVERPLHLERGPPEAWLPAITLAASPSSTAPFSKRTTIHAVKAYRTERMTGGIKFTCTHCEHSVSTLDFDPKAGNLRTQAATAINQHATQAHHAPPMFSSVDVQLRTWRT
jgi:hypothetical protein